MNVVAIVQARMGSTRLPGKVLRNLAGYPVLTWVVKRLQASAAVDSVLVATSTAASDDAIATFCQTQSYPCYRGDEDDVLARFLAAAQSVAADIVVRITADCPLIAPAVVDDLIAAFRQSHVDYMSCVHIRSFPRGLDCEAMTVETLARAARLGTEKRHREHVTPFIYENTDLFQIALLQAQGALARPDIRLCIDDATDFETIEALLQSLVPTQVIDVAIADIIRLVDTRPDLLAIMNTAEGRHLQKNVDEGIHQRAAGTIKSDGGRDE